MAVFNPTRYKQVSELSELVIQLTQEYENLVQLEELLSLARLLPACPRKEPLIEALTMALFGQTDTGIGIAPYMGNQLNAICHTRQPETPESRAQEIRDLIGPGNEVIEICEECVPH